MINEEYLTRTIDWRELFSPSDLEEAKQLLAARKFKNFTFSPTMAKATVEELKGKSSQQVSISGAPASYSDSWDSRYFRCSCRRNLYSYGRKNTPCAHKALVLMLWEKGRGPWVFRESEEEHQERLIRERRAEEKQRREELWAKEGEIPAEPVSILPKKKAGETALFFDLREALEQEKTTLYALNRARELLSEGKSSIDQPSLTYYLSGEQCLTVDGYVRDMLSSASPKFTLLRNRLAEVRCNCRYAWKYGLDYYSGGNERRRGLCEHVLTLCGPLWNYLNRENPGDATDQAAERLFHAFEDISEAKEQEEDHKAERQKSLVLTPLIQLNTDAPLLGFRIGKLGGKSYLLKNPRALINAYDDGATLSFGKNLEADFSREDFTEESMAWLTFLHQKVSETDEVNERLTSRRRFGYYGSATLSVSNKEALSGTYLDRFYDLTEGSSVEVSSSGRGSAKSIQVGHKSPRILLEAEAMTRADGEVIGLEVRGEMPLFLEGVLDIYLLDGSSLSKSTSEELSALAPLAAAANGSRRLIFRIGKAGLGEYYYRILPDLMANPYISYEDKSSGSMEELLPPEAVFRFRLSYDEHQDILCQAFVSYEDREYPLWKEPEEEGYRDKRQESRVKEALVKYFSPSPEGFTAYGDEDTLYQILTEGVSELSRFGRMEGTKEFKLELVRPAPSMHVGVSVESGLMELSLLSEDLKEEELLAIWNSYRLKKKYYRLSSGEFVSLSGSASLESADELAKAMELSPEELMGHPVKLPLYRALYLNKMLEAHDELSADRDRTYRRLINSFNTIRDGEYEPPSGLSGTLRPYQLYGYKWLRTLDAAGFGGILADEMGLGKTIQMIAHLEALKEEGKLSLSLVVCPAALIYNWQEEFARFAPGLPTQAAAGGIKERRALYRRLQEDKEGSPLIVITSYELLRKDITAYEPLSFHTVVLDEAQYIKNMKAAVTKAVKAIKARHRFALTGTPIENRLSELWSIFDFLMPGFFYRHEEFQRRFETPITKNREETATKRLKDMVSPFLLRRLKADVLKDLPPKLEEVRYARFEEEQKRLYDAQVIRLRSLLGEMAPEGSTVGRERMEVFAELMRIRQICCDPSLVFEDYAGESAKREACMTLVESALEGGHRMLIFSQFASMLELLERDLSDRDIPCLKITGKTPKDKRLSMVHSFNEGNCPVFLISLKAGGTGLNLTGADIVIHYDPWWNLAAQNQATDRAHRIGQKKQVSVYRIIVKDTIEERILNMQEAKKDLAEAVLSGEESSLFTLSAKELMELL